MKYPTPTIFLSEEEDGTLYKIATELGMTRTEFIHNAIIEKINNYESQNNDRDNK